MIVEWDSDLPTKIYREGSSWEETEGFIQDKTKSGKMKRRGAFSQLKRPFAVKMRFTDEQYHIFHEWYETETKKGVYSFHFPQIDSSDKSILKTYRFAEGGAPKYSPNNQYLDVTMKWEEV